MSSHDSVRESYDRIPYRTGSQSQTHPDRLATIAFLAGLSPAPPSRCRVLELGCATGGNVIPMAFELRESTFIGVDLSPVQIERGREEIAVLGLDNIELHAKSILDLGSELGVFDYIVCHGVFSWVPAEVREKILDVCRDHLAPDGVAYISYNTYPGWFQRRMLREMLLFHTRNVDDPEARAAQSFELVDFLADAVADATETHAVYLRAAREHLDDYRDQPSYLLHEYLEETNAPIYFTDMVAAASQRGLRYLDDAEPHEMELDNLAPAVADRLRAFSANAIEQQQYLDFVANRTFRRSLFALAPEAPSVDRHARIATMHVASASKPVSEVPELRGGASESFRTEKGKPFSSDHPVAKATLVALAAAWPRAVAFGALLDDVTTRLTRAGVPMDAGAILPDLVDALFRSGVVELHIEPPPCANTVSSRPRASALARRQASQGLLVTSQRRRVLKLDDPMARFLLLQLDGTQDRAALVRLLDREVSAGRLDVRDGDAPITRPERIPAVLEAIVEHHLRRMAQLALLVE
ncbi:MAG TPA: methyltransferase regulatory domain-containing protein [Thermoanaerobaculia bacterium]|nr:methyltransferase regulatory domain-containing protein [Thermoanaerobaculia bacterium]